jgi:hypothetical protein
MAGDTGRPRISDVRANPIGFCIYCGADGKSVKLSDEHAIPYGLDGWVVLPKASCQPCAAATGSVEHFCLRKMFLAARTHMEMRTRDRKNRPTELPVYVATAAGREKRLLPVDDHPFLLRLPRLGRPPYLTGSMGSGWVAHIADEKGDPFWAFVGARNPAKVKGMGTELGWDTEYAPTIFCLLLAKIDLPHEKWTPS